MPKNIDPQAVRRLGAQLRSLKVTAERAARAPPSRSRVNGGRARRRREERFQRPANELRGHPGCARKTMKSDLLNMSLCEVAQAIRKKRVSSLEVVRACIERAKAVQPAVNCFIAIEEDEVLRAARVADRAVKRGAKLGPLHGVPLAHKDMFYRAGRVSTGGSKILRDYRPAVTATVVERLAAAGAIWLGNLNMAEFAANPTGHNSGRGASVGPASAPHWAQQGRQRERFKDTV